MHAARFLTRRPGHAGQIDGPRGKLAFRPGRSTLRGPSFSLAHLSHLFSVARIRVGAGRDCATPIAVAHLSRHAMRFVAPISAAM
jgi:hypothetical protein